MDKIIPLNDEVFYNPIHSSLEHVSDGSSIHLTPNEKKLLEIVLDDRGRKETIIDEIWTRQGIVVSESSYHQLVKMLRRKFQEASLMPSALKTIPRYGIVMVNVKKDDEEIDLEQDEGKQCETLGCEQIEQNIESEFTEETSETPMFSDKLRVTQPEGSDKKSGLGVLSLLIGVLALLMIFIPMLWVYAQNNTSVFSQQMFREGVTYHTMSSTYLSRHLLERVANGLDDRNTDVYIGTNGPKTWVAYCNSKIEKENARCAYTHFSAY
jgi:DNA-binding winged helix-turn-helix (wHTH) protein